MLRALHLFFNGYTNPERPFNFTIDFARARSEEVKRTPNARKFIYVKITFHTPPSYRASLGREFFVKKTWSVQNPNGFQEHSSTIRASNVGYLSRFLGQVSFYYIPAIKDRKIFQYLLALLHRTLSADEAFQRSLSEFSSQVQERTKALAESIEKNLALRSVLAPPKNVDELFQALDFDTNSPTSEDTYSLTLQRGDGIQVRHIPEILRFICDKGGSRYHIWGFEEPENSLELANALEEARALLTHASSKRIQCFTTSHSPAFFNLRADNVERYFVSKKEMHGVHVSEVADITHESDDDCMLRMGDSVYLPRISASLSKALAEADEAAAAKSQLENRLARLTKPVLFVEGTTDIKVFTAAIKLFAPQLLSKIEIKDGPGTKGLRPLVHKGEALSGAVGSRRIFVIVDDDHAARELWESGGSGKLPAPGTWASHANGTHWLRLPPTGEASEILARLGLATEPAITLEGMFSCELRRNAIAAGAYSFEAAPFENYRKRNTIWDLARRFPPAPQHDEAFFLYPAGGTIKDAFTDWVTSRENVTEGNYSAFAPIVGTLRDLIAGIEGEEQRPGAVAAE